MLTRVVDYLLVPGDGTPLDAPDGITVAGDGAPVLLGNGVALERLDDGLAQRLLAACELRGERWEPNRQFGVIQAFVRELDVARFPQAPLYDWDHDHVLFGTLALSRLVRPHAIACDYVARQLVDDDGSERLVPYDASEARVAYRIEDGSRGWLDLDDAERLRALLAAYQPDHLPGRVTRAFRLAETMVRARFLEDTLPLVVTGLEALLKLGRRNLTEQFAQRTSALAGEFGIQLTEDQCADAYDDRSGIVHGAHLDLMYPADFTQFQVAVDRLQQTLRAAIHKAIDAPEFGALFASDAMILGRWPSRRD
jgi:hypothetical protein